MNLLPQWEGRWVGLSPMARPGDVRPKTAFTLLEMMTAVAVLSIMMVMLGQILGMVSAAWIDGQSHVNNFTKARAMLNIFASDIQSGLFRSDLCAFPSDGSGGTLIKFYTKRQGLIPGGGTARDISIVQYAYGSDQSTPASMSTLQRGDLYFSWTSDASAITFGNTADFGSNTPVARDTAAGVVSYKVVFVYADGTLSTTYTASTSNPLRAVGLTLAVVDDRTLQLLQAGQVQSLRQTFDTAVTASALAGTRSVKAIWEECENGTLNWNTYPKSLAVGLKIFEFYVNLPGS